VSCAVTAEWRVGFVMMRGVACTTACIYELVCDNRREALLHIFIKLGLGYGMMHNLFIVSCPARRFVVTGYQGCSLYDALPVDCAMTREAG
jgi:hypothetical protein